MTWWLVLRCLDPVVSETRYMVREAVLVRTENGSAWSVHFTPTPTRGSEDGEIVALISPVDIDEMLFATPYTLEEIRALEDGHPGG